MKRTIKLLFGCIFALVLFSCAPINEPDESKEIEKPNDKNQVSGNDTDTSTNTPNVSFNNKSEYKVVVFRDGLNDKIAEIDAEQTKSAYVAPGANEITFHFRYSYCVLNDDDNGTVWMDVQDSAADTYPIDSKDIADGVLDIDIHEPKNPQFRDAFLVVANKSDKPISLYDQNIQLKVYNSEKFNILPGHSGVYSIAPGVKFEGFKIKTPGLSATVDPFYVERGALYKCVFDGTDSNIIATEELRNQFYDVSFDANDGTAPSVVKTRLLEESAMPQPTRNGYGFAGWCTDSELQNQVVYPYYVRADITLYAKWLQLFTVTFETNGGNAIPFATEYSLEESKMPASPVRKGYDFAGWHTDSGLQNKAAYPYGLTADTTLYAKWIERCDTAYTVRHYQQNADRNSYSLVKTDSLKGTTNAATAASARNTVGFAAKTFEQKNISADGTTIVDIYYDRKSYAVTFNANGGSGDKYSQTFYYGEAPQPLDDNIFTRSGYIFLGWATSNTGDCVYDNQADFAIGG